MKPVKTIPFISCIRCTLLCFLTALAANQLSGQCSSTLQTITNHIYLNGSGNNSWGFSIPQFDPSVGTLVAVKINSVVSVNLNFQLSNLGSTTQNYTVQGGRVDNISSSALSAPIINNFTQNYGPYNLQAAMDTVGAGTVASPQFFSLMGDYNITDSITTSVVGFLGTGYVAFSYNPNTYSSVTTGSDYGLNTTASDTMQMTFTYYYCAQNILPRDIINFSVTKEEGSMAEITWDTENEMEGRMYEIEESADGSLFYPVADVSAVVNNSISNYNYGYPIPAGISGKLYFRLRETNADGYISYSPIRTLTLDGSGQPCIYPNPASTFINIAFGQPGPQAADAGIFSADGMLVERHQLSTSPAYITFTRQLARGAYFVRLTSSKGATLKTIPFIVQ